MSQRETHYPRLGEEIDRLARSLAAVKGWKMTATMLYISQCTHYSPDMIHRWRQGKICPSSETLEILAKIGKEEANLLRGWGESLLDAAQYTNTTNLINKLWGPKKTRVIPCNLPSRNSAPLIGRHSEIKRLLELLSPRHAASLITIDGIGGVGKTALALEVACQCWRNSEGEELVMGVPHFDAIVFISAKQQYLVSDIIIPSNKAKRALRDIIHEIASTLERFDITSAAPQEKFSYVYKALAHQAILLIIDNLETMEDKQEIMSFLFELPPSVKIVITTRERVLAFSPIRLGQLSQEEAFDLIKKEAESKEAKINREHTLSLYRHIGGIPAALVYAIGQIASGYSIETVLRRIPMANSDVARFCFEGSLQPLRGKSAHHLLMAIAMFTKPPLRVAFTYTAGLTMDQIGVEESLTQLDKLSLIRQPEGEVRYVMLPLTREYALSELAANPVFEQKARLQWVEWYLNFTQDHGGKDWQDWNIRYDRIEEEWENLLAVFDWCAAREQYDTIYTFWQERHMVKFAHIYGYWDDRLFWLKWLIQAAEKRGNWSEAVKPMIDLSFTLTLMDHLEEAERYLQRAWELRTHVDARVQLILIQKIIDLRIQQKDFTNALEWLSQAKTLLDITATYLEEPERTRRWVDFQSHKGIIYYKQGDYDQARPCYQDMLSQAQTIHWRRVEIYARNHLAYIAVMQDKLEEAEALLQMSLPVDKDMRLAAFYKYTSAYLCLKMGKSEEAYRLAKEAKDSFEQLGMKNEIKETEELLQKLQN